MAMRQESSTREEKGMTRRAFMRLGFWGAVGLLSLEGLWATLVSLMPKAKAGSLGSKIAAGEVADYPVGSITHFPEGHFYISRLDSGFLALRDVCTHLGCIVPWKTGEQSEDRVAETGRFNCPCHAGIYDRYGVVHAGPPPRPLDLFPLSIEAGKLVVNTGIVIQRQRYEESQVVKG